MGSVPRIRALVAALGTAMVLVACSSSGSDTPPSATGEPTGSTGAVTGATPQTGPTGSTAATGATGATADVVDGAAPDACVLLTDADASEVLGGPVERVADPVGAGLITGEPDSFLSVCYYRPDPDDFSSFASLVVIAPGSTTEAEIEVEAATGRPLEGLGDEAFVVGEQAVSVRAGAVLFAVFVIGGPDGAPDTTAAELLARRAVERL